MDALCKAAGSTSPSGEKELRRSVLEATAILLDHPKRVVRKAAADVRNAWLTL